MFVYICAYVCAHPSLLPPIDPSRYEYCEECLCLDPTFQCSIPCFADKWKQDGVCDDVVMLADMFYYHHGRKGECCIYAQGAW